MGYPVRVSHILVPLTGLEPVRVLPQGILSPWCLPIPPQRHKEMLPHFCTTVKHYILTKFALYDTLPLAEGSATSFRKFEGIVLRLGTQLLYLFLFSERGKTP